MKTGKGPKSSGPAQARRTAGVLALLTAGTVDQAAELAGVSRTTLFVWLRDPAFQDELTRARATAFDGGLGTIRGGCEEAARVLLALLKSRNETTRRKAAETVLAFALKIHEGHDLEARLQALEAAVAGRPGG
jgi:hypothetical protein